MVELESDEGEVCEAEFWQAASMERESMRQNVIIFFIANLLYQNSPLLGSAKHRIMKKGRKPAPLLLLIKTLCQLWNHLFLARNGSCQEGMVVFQFEVEGSFHLVHVGTKG